MNSKSSKSGLFLMELILSILIFSLAATVCVQMFVKGHSLSEESVRLNHGVIWCQGLADSFYGCDGDLKEMNQYLDNSVLSDNESRLCIFYDEDFNCLSSDTGHKYCVEGLLKSEDDLLILNITCKDSSDGQIIYELSPTLYPVKEIN